ncbi:MAG TPA: hypothetical protein VIY47_15550 [Ignavibacteriaceae bacterium]
MARKTEEVEEEYYDLTLTKEGKVIQKSWFYDREKEEGKYVYADVSHDLISVFDKTVKIEDGFTLQHLCDLLLPDVELYDIILRNCFVVPFIKEYQRILAEGYVAPAHEYSPDGIEYLYLYWSPEMDGDYIWGTDRPDFDGQGWELQEEKQEEGFSYPKGHRINWGLDFLGLNEMLHLPIQADEEMKIRDDLANWKVEDGPSQKTLFSCKKKYTMKNVVEGIFWEISFHGGPAGQAEFKEEMEQCLIEVKEALNKEKIDPDE